MLGLTIPKEYADAARIDGCGEWGVLLRVVVPMARPGIAAAGIFLFFHAWNDYFGPLLYASENPLAWPVSSSWSRRMVVARRIQSGIQLGPGWRWQVV